MTQAQHLPPEALARGLACAGFVLVGYELGKDMIWETVMGGEYLLFQKVVESAKLLNETFDGGPEICAVKSASTAT